MSDFIFYFLVDFAVESGYTLHVLVAQFPDVDVFCLLTFRANKICSVQYFRDHGGVEPVRAKALPLFWVSSQNKYDGVQMQD